MIVTCEACFTNFNLNDELIKPSGSKVRCSKCNKVFKVFPFVPEEISPPPLTDLSDETPAFSFSDPFFETPPLKEPGVQQMAAPDQLPETPALPADFENIDEFDFSELDALLQEDDKGKSGSAFVNLQEDQPLEPFLSSSETTEPKDLSEASDNLTESDFSGISLDLSDVNEQKNERGTDFKTAILFETEESDYLSDKSDETAELALSEISFDESFNGADDQSAGVNLEDDLKLGPSETKPQVLSLDDFENSLEMDFSDISLVSSTEKSETAPDRKKDIAEMKIESDQTPEEALSGFNDIETLDLSDIESLLEKQDVRARALNEGAENFNRADSVIIPPPSSSTETAQTLEMKDQYLTFDELQLDKDDSKTATLLEIKESFQPPSPEISKHPTAPSPQPGSFRPEAVSEDKEKETSFDADIDEEAMDTSPAPKKGINPLILIALVLAVIAGAGYGGYVLLNSKGISIPFISQPTPAKISDPGNLSIKLFDISSNFVDNHKIGKLFVITGKVKNEYPMARGSIQINGKLYTKDKTMAKSESVFCGNILSDIDLTNADLASLQQRLQNPSGDNLINQKVLPGAAIPFMIIFSNLPSNLEEFTTEVIKSAPS